MTGDLVDSAQRNEFAEAKAILAGGRVDPDSGAAGYRGVQQASNNDRLYYRPEVDPPRNPGLATAAQRPYTASGLAVPWYPLPGNHDLLMQGYLVARPATQSVAVGRRKLVELHPRAARAAERGRLSGRFIGTLLARRASGRRVRVAPDPARKPLSPARAVRALRNISGHGGNGPLMDDVVDLGDRVRLVMLDTARRRDGVDGLVRDRQVPWLRRALATAGDRRVVVFSSTPLTETRNGAAALALLDKNARVVALIAGDTHRNSIRPRSTSGGGYWLITTSGLADYPQQARAFRLCEAGAGVVLETWMLDASGSPLANTARRLAYLDYQGGRPHGLAGDFRDRNARLYVATDSVL